MMGSVIKNILVKAAYGVVGLAAAWLGEAANITPSPDDLANQVWFTLIAGLLVGLSAQIKRWLSTRKEA
jgi:hypothetical protein